MSKGLKKRENLKKEQERERKAACRIDRKVRRRIEAEGSEGGWCFSLKSLPTQKGNILSTGICHHSRTQLKPI